MKAIQNNPEALESTYALLVRSEEKQRSRFETLIYTLLLVSIVFALSQFGRQTAMLPSSLGRVSIAVPAETGHGA